MTWLKILSLFSWTSQLHFQRKDLHSFPRGNKPSAVVLAAECRRLSQFCVHTFVDFPCVQATAPHVSNPAPLQPSLPVSRHGGAGELSACGRCSVGGGTKVYEDLIASYTSFQPFLLLSVSHLPSLWEESCNFLGFCSAVASTGS